MKKAARTSLKKHYLIFVIVCVLTAYMGSEFVSALNMLNITPTAEEAVFIGEENESKEELNGRVGTRQNGVVDVLEGMLSGKDDEQKQKSQELEGEERTENTNSILGRSRGVFAKAVNAVTSGSI